jgi:hypothetical protein
LTAPNIGGSGGVLEIMIPVLAPDDGNPVSGDDEGVIAFWTRVVDGTPGGADISNCATATPEFGIGDQSCASTAMPKLDVSKAQDVVDQNPETPIPDVNPGDVFSYLITATNLFDHAVFLTIHDALDEYLDHVAGTFTVNGTTASDEFFTDDILEYQHPDLIQPGQTLELEFDVIVQDFAPHNWVIGNEALITASLDPQNLSGYAVTLETNLAEVRVENPIPEPSTGIFLATGLLVFLALERKRRNTRK